jgi:ABC-type Fe2+-enterobactin transport system substrate-binding protein
VNKTKFPQMQIDYERIRKTMQNKMAAVVICIAAFAVSAAAQTTVTNGNNGVSGQVPVYSGPATIGSSAVTITGTSGGSAQSAITSLSTQPLQYRGHCGVQ